jgi:hypothetical protein
VADKPPDSDSDNDSDDDKNASRRSAPVMNSSAARDDCKRGEISESGDDWELAHLCDLGEHIFYSHE